MNKKLLFLTGEGIGNVIQCLPVIRTLKEVLKYEIYLDILYGSYNIDYNIFPYISNNGPMLSKNIGPDYFSGVVSTCWTSQLAKSLFNCKNNPTPLSMGRSEVDCYMDIARDLGVKEKDIIWEATCNYNKRSEKFDVVIANGYNKYGSAHWEIKGYPYYEKVVDKLVKQGYSVASIGSKNEYIKGTVNMTGLPLLDSAGIIKNSRCFLSNDTGSYHMANALNVYNLVIFTATSTVKNYDKRFHKYSTIIGREDLLCRPCQGNRRWTKDCVDWKCREVVPEYVVEKAEELLNR